MERLSGWGRASSATTMVSHPLRVPEAIAAFRGGAIHGAGRSYGDCAFDPDGATLVTVGLNRILGFDADTGIAEVEPGVNFRQLLQTFLPQGFLVPVTPGTGFATIGGAVAHDVHGKNHERLGSFGQHVTALDVVLPGGQPRRITPADQSLFRATIGGMGLTGLITRIAFRMQRVPGGTVRVRENRAPDLDRFLAGFEDGAGATYSVGWIDGTARGRQLGRGILELAEPSEGPVTPPPARWSVPFDVPGFVLNPASIALFNEAYYRRIPPGGRVREAPLATFLYPLDAIGHWNRIYGPRGFHQFQCAVPHASAPAALQSMLELIAQTRQASFLAVLKRMGPGRAGYLSFPMEGYTLAMDFPNRPGVSELYNALCRLALEAGGRVYLAKDGLLSPDLFRAMYPEFPAFRQVLAELDPGGRITSSMARRLHIHAPV